MNLDYLLVVITHGEAPHLPRVLEAWRQMVEPAPGSIRIFVDGDGSLPADENMDWRAEPSERQMGFCGNTRRAWLAAADCGLPFVAWLEHDFIVTRPVDLSLLAAVLDDDLMLAQMQLMRNAVNDQEKAAGGLFESRPGQYEQRFTNFTFTSAAYPFLVQKSYLSSNVSIMRREFMQKNPWPEYSVECEGRFGIDLIQRGYSFGVWGSGEAWTEHIGVRDGSGFGY